LDPEYLEAHAAQVKKTGNKLFWNPAAKRFACSIDVDGTMWDYGYTFLNLEAVHFNFATQSHARDILDWVCGDRIVEGDTSQGDDIYFWRFGPRATTKRNIDYYVWGWSGPESIPFGGQVQDGGAVLGWSYHDLMARLRVRGPDSAAERLSAVLAWFDEVTAAGGYRAYYDGSRPGTMQGGGTAGGLGLDKEFFESVLVPQIVFDGFLGFRPTADGCRIDPALPTGWPELTVTRVRLHDAILTVRVTSDQVEISVDAALGASDRALVVEAPAGRWQVPNGGVTERADDGAEVVRAELALQPGSSLTFSRPE
ncbi:MAG: hypothetical protein GY851_17585, partial [bacterium]|nr:hypothetical protein [bacterium]